jgi:hypothetical protein
MHFALYKEQQQYRSSAQMSCREDVGVSFVALGVLELQIARHSTDILPSRILPKLTAIQNPEVELQTNCDLQISKRPLQRDSHHAARGARVRGLTEFFSSKYN